ncbi:hypothetical protein SFRURICE_006425 [Spodoptera frugiperda]|nr:hypothetical protein SFRURICE_006425 [Spodoptera frugiperda]
MAPESEPTFTDLDPEETSTVPRQFLLQLIECVFRNQRTFVETPPAPVGIDESPLLQSLAGFTRRANPMNHMFTVIHTTLEMIRNSRLCHSMCIYFHAVLYGIVTCAINDIPLEISTVPRVSTAPPAPVGIDESPLLQSLAGFTRRANPMNHMSTDVIQTILERLRFFMTNINEQNGRQPPLPPPTQTPNRQSTDQQTAALTNERNQINESRAKEILNAERSRPSASNISNNGFSQFINGHTAESANLTAVASSIRYPNQPPPSLPPPPPPPPLPSSALPPLPATVPQCLPQHSHHHHCRICSMPVDLLRHCQLMQLLIKMALSKDLPSFLLRLYRQQLQKLECEHEFQSYLFEKKSAEYANGRLLLKSAVSSDWFRILDEYIEESSEPTQHELSQFNPASTFTSVSVSHITTLYRARRSVRNR